MLSPAQKRNIKRFVSRRLNIDPLIGQETSCELPYKLLIGTHHKTGTVWLKLIFEAICTEFSLKLAVGSGAQARTEYDVFLHPHSRFDLHNIEHPVRGLHVIRDPRDVILSGCFYHQTSDEAWLHTPRSDLGGRTYQAALNSCPTLDDKILFEMENTGRATIQEMTQWDYTLPSFYELKYEDLIRDTDLVLFHRAFSFLGFPARLLPVLLAIAYRNSLFSGLVGPSGHIRSAEAAQWPRYFTPRHKERFLELFGDALIRLGYEQDDAWATRL